MQLACACCLLPRAGDCATNRWGAGVCLQPWCRHAGTGPRAQHQQLEDQRCQCGPSQRHQHHHQHTDIHRSRVSRTGCLAGHIVGPLGGTIITVALTSAPSAIALSWHMLLDQLPVLLYMRSIRVLYLLHGAAKHALCELPALCRVHAVPQAVC